jgi:hypothetical protein
MPQAEIVQFQKKQESAFVCAACGADRDCDCNAPGMKKKRVEEYLTKHPDASTRTAAADLGVSKTTVQEVRQSGVHQRTPVIGRDGKQYPVRQQTPHERVAAADKLKDRSESAVALADFKKACNQLLPKLTRADMKIAIDHFRSKSGFF